MNNIGVDLTHVYGLTETYGPAAVCAKHATGLDLPLAEQVDLNGRQGVRYHCAGRDHGARPGEHGCRCPGTSETMGEIMFRGNLVMKGYLKNPKATEESLPAAGTTPAIWR
jgi:fatty-acyl-CoA synthase